MLGYSKAVDDLRLRREAAKLVWKIQSWIQNPGLLGRPYFAGQITTSKLADLIVMIMQFELMSADEDPRYSSALAAYIKAALKHHEPRTTVFLENVGVDGVFNLESPDGRLLNPGHSIEMAWFLPLAVRRQPDAAVQAKVLKILGSSQEYGWDKKYGGIFYFMDIEGHPVSPLEATMKLWWPLRRRCMPSSSPTPSRRTIIGSRG